MSRQDPRQGCLDFAFSRSYALSEGAEVALEDYARALTRARSAEAVRASDDPATVRGVHVCGMGMTLTPALLRDLEDFARSLIMGPGGGGLGWS